MIRMRPMVAEDLAVFQHWLYTAHVAQWYHEPLDWIVEVEQQDGAFHWLRHYIVEHNDTPIGFCQYYACVDSEEPWGGYTALGGSYSIDYMIGEREYLGRGFGRQIVCALIEMIRAHSDAKRIVVQPESENKASCGVLLACGFAYDLERDIYVFTL